MKNSESWPRQLWITAALLSAFVPAIFISARWQQDVLSSDLWLSPRLAITILLAAICGALAALSKHRTWPGLLAAGLFLIGAGFLFALAPNDDAYIFFRYVENSLSGYGPVFNPGEFVEGFSSPLWFLALLASGALGGIKLLPLISVAGGIVSSWFICTGVASATRSLGAPRLAGLAAVITAVWFPILFWAWSGMGTALYLALLAWAVTLTFRAFDTTGRNRERLLLGTTLLMTLATLTRPESVLLLGAHMIWCSAMGSKPLLRWILKLATIPIIVFGVLLVIRPQYYGLLLPNTYYCKVGSLFELAHLGADYLSSGLVALVPIAIPGLMALVRQTPGRKPSAYIASLLVAHIIVIFATGADYYIEMRFFTPFWVLLIPPAMSEFEIGSASSRLFDSRTIRIAGAACLTVAIFVTGFLYQSRGPHSVRFFGRVLVDRWTVFGSWANATTDGCTVIASPVIGAIGFFSKRPVIDMLGLTDPVISHHPRAMGGPKGHDRSDASYVLSRSPDIIFLDGWWKNEADFLEDQHWIPAVQDFKVFLPSPQYRFTNLQMGNVHWSIYERITPAPSSEAAAHERRMDFRTP